MEIMESLGRTVVDHPGKIIALTVAVTILMTASIGIIGLETEADQDIYLPESDLVDAFLQIQREYGTKHTIPLLIRSTEDDILTVDSLIDILRIENALVNDNSTRERLSTPGNPSESITSIADIITGSLLISILVEQDLYLQNPTHQEKLWVLQGKDNVTFTGIAYNEYVTNQTVEIRTVTIDLLPRSTEEIKQAITAMLHPDNDEIPTDIKGMIPRLLTSDFDPGNQRFMAKGTIGLIQLNGTTIEDESMDAENDRFEEWESRILKIVDSTEKETVTIDVLGSRLIGKEIQDASDRSMAILMPLAFILVIVILAIVFRNLLDILFSLFSLVFAIIWVYGAGVLLGFTFNPMTTVVPILVIGLGIDFSIHVILRYREELKMGKDFGESAFQSIRTVGVALLLATITTVVSFLSNLSSPIGVIKEFGILCAIGISSSFLIMVTFLPACRLIMDNRRLRKKTKQRMTTQNIHGQKGSEKVNDGNPSNANTSNSATSGSQKIPDIERESGSPTDKKNSREVGVRFLDRSLASVAVIAEHHPKPAIIIVLILTAIAFGGALQLKAEFNMEDFLPPDLEMTKDIQYMSDNFKTSSEEAYIYIEADMTDPDVLKAMNMSIQNMSDDQHVLVYYGEPQTESILSLMKDYAEDSTTTESSDTRYDQAFSIMFFDSDLDGDGIPDKNITELYNWLYGHDQKSKEDTISILHRSNDTGAYDGGVIRIQVDTQDLKKAGKLHDELLNDVKPIEDLEGTKVNTVSVTGGSILAHVIITSLEKSQINSLILTLLVTGLMLTLVFWFYNHSKIIGIITTIPVLLVVCWVLGTMYFTGIPLNIMTMIIAALTVGSGIDYAIHITHRFLEELENSDDVDTACRNTVTNTGTALFGAAITTFGGFGILAFSILPPLRQFGVITALMILFGFLSSVFILPIFLVLWAKWKNSRSIPPENEKPSHPEKGGDLKNEDSAEGIKERTEEEGIGRSEENNESKMPGKIEEEAEGEEIVRIEERIDEEDMMVEKSTGEEEMMAEERIDEEDNGGE